MKRLDDASLEKRFTDLRRYFTESEHVSALEHDLYDLVEDQATELARLRDENERICALIRPTEFSDEDTLSINLRWRGIPAEGLLEGLPMPSDHADDCLCSTCLEIIRKRVSVHWAGRMKQT